MPRKSLILLSVCLATLTINLSAMIVNIALPTLATDLDATTKDLLWIVDGYNLAFAALVLAMGSLSDRFGRRPALIVGLVGFAASSGSAVLADSSTSLIVIRFVMGMFAALIFPTTLSIIANTFTERRERASALGLWGAAVGAGVALGPVSGGFLLAHFSWHSVFLALVPLSLAAAALAFAFVPESRDPEVPRIDRPGFLISVAAVGSLTWTIIEAPEHGWGSAATLIGFVVAAVLTAMFVLVERSVANPMIDVTLFLDRRFSAACGAVTIAFFALFGFIFLIAQFFQFVRDYSALETGVRFLPVAVAIAVASIVGSQLAPRIGTKLVVSAGLVLLGAAFLWISALTSGVDYATVVAPQMVMLGLGTGLVSTAATESIMQVLPPSRAGVGSAVNDATRELGGTLGVAVVGSLFASAYADGLRPAIEGRLDAVNTERALDSVGYADAVAARVPGLASAVDAAFLDGLALGCITVGILCLVGAVAALVALPGRGFEPREAEEQDELPDEARVLQAIR
ncbi:MULTISPECIES: MFS transporter [unclassified Nocardioides]|uniref:MFS transporter n=1 Tax=unclassified Nocardioides TaxID=2615069 RepID=UPI0006F78C46|nr:MULTISPECIES: MFS transporter [unclassified Nocardioides]KRA28039.1 transporter [Nocardioides sp. Root614]KRA86014.1 transporter [Nocardioides sp. Root682]